ncbi:hypothetical protein [Nocardioides speluncae]|uniref:hypothetical protein n=1 Tax=Nocardioides speluncae TaxID=2670337 RepID=UPI0012B164C2|nr:hypothetical protein [Nocardioides speluncae]
MLDAGAPRDDWNAEIPTLIAAGQKRVRRRKLIAAGTAAAVIAIIGTTAALTGIPGLNRADPDPVKPDKSGFYVEERLAPAEVERRCTIVMNADGQTKYTWVTDSTETRVGRTIAMQTTDLTGNGGSHAAAFLQNCVIPQEKMLHQPRRAHPAKMPLPTDTDALTEQCSRQASYDFTDWTILASAARGRPGVDGVNVVLMSANGYAVHCNISPPESSTGIRFGEGRLHDDEGEPILPPDDAGPEDPDRYVGIAPRCYREERQIRCLSTGVIPGLPDGYRIEVVRPDGSVKEFVTNRGAFAIVVRSDKESGTPDRLDAKVMDQDGGVLWDSAIER